MKLQRCVIPYHHQCSTDFRIWECVEYGWDLGNLRLKISVGDPYEDGYEHEIIVKYCPFCGYQPEVRNKALDELVEQAQELDVGY